MTEAAAYLRVSGRGQVKGHGFSRQRDTIRRYAKEHRIELVGEFQDEGVSGGKESADRPGLSRLIEQIAGNGIDLVLVERADRLARDLIVGELILDELCKHGVKVVAADSGADLTAGDGDPTRVLIRQVLGAVSQFEKSVIVAKLRAARDRKRRTTGRCEGRKPYGTHPSEKPVVQRIRALRRKRPGGRPMSYAAIAKVLNDDGVSTRHGGPWRASTIASILGRR